MFKLDDFQFSTKYLLFLDQKKDRLKDTIICRINGFEIVVLKKFLHKKEIALLQSKPVLVEEPWKYL